MFLLVIRRLPTPTFHQIHCPVVPSSFSSKRAVYPLGNLLSMIFTFIDAYEALGAWISPVTGGIQRPFR